MKNLIYQGSVKNIYRNDCTLEFEFTDQYSIFDWGIMPDTILDKGKNLALMATFFFEKLMTKETYQKLTKPAYLSHDEFISIIESNIFSSLKSNGAKTHFIKYQSPASLIVKPVDILKPEFSDDKYHYEKYDRLITNTLIPLEVVFRFGAPAGSGLLKRNKNIQPNQMFQDIIIDFYTKLEPQDRYLTKQEAQKISGLSDKEFSELCSLTKIFAIVLENTFSYLGIILWDGKFEFAFGESINNEREIILIDSIGPDELRLTKDSMILSKEYLRSLYKTSEWYEELQNLKSIYPNNFREKISTNPKKLHPDELKNAINIYQDITKSLLGSPPVSTCLSQNISKKIKKTIKDRNI